MGFRAGQTNLLIRPDISPPRHGIVPGHFEVGIFFKTGDKKDAFPGPLSEQSVIHISSVHHDDGAIIEGQAARHMNVMTVGLDDQDIGRHVVIMVQKDIGFNAALGQPEFGPGKKRQTKADGGGVRAEKLVSKTKLMFTCAEDTLTSKTLHRQPEYRFKQFGRPMPVGIERGGFIRSLLDPEVN